MSLIPKINVGKRSKKNRFHIPAFTHGTSEIGYVIPSYSRNLINDATIKIGTRSIVRLSPLFVPTMGDLTVRHYHFFVPFNRIWTPYDAFMAREPFAFPNGYSQVPTNVPKFVVGVLLRHLMQSNVSSFDYYDTDNLRSQLTMSLYVDASDAGDKPIRVSASKFGQIFGVHTLTNQISSSYIDQMFNDSSMAIQEGSNYTYGGVPSVMFVPSPNDEFDIPYTLIGDIGEGAMSYTGHNIYYSAQQIGSDVYDDILEYVRNLSVPSYENCDFMDTQMINGTKVYMCYNFNGAWKRLRSIFMGLGYAFNPYDTEFVTPLKLLAFYRCYWSLFGVNRGINFQDTICAQITREISNLSGGEMNDWREYHTTLRVFCEQELVHCTYTTPADYFSSSVVNTQEGIKTLPDGQEILSSIVGNVQSLNPLNVQAAAIASDSDNYPASALNFDSNIPALGIDMAQRILRRINRRTVVGSAIYDGLRSLFGNIEVNDESTEGCIKIGDDSVFVDIGAIFNQSDFTTDSGAPLGSFAGVGQGRSNKTKYYRFDAPSFGCVITLTAVVPQMGYFQGMLRENSDGCNDSYEMFDPIYDAVGWQTVRYNELSADRQFKNNTVNVQVGTALGNFGAQPRFTHMKCSFNRVIGDISLPHLQDSMLPYTLDRFFHQRKPLPRNVPLTFRSATQGNTNRIFQVVSPTDDHVIWQVFFDVDMYANMKSVSDSYDTHLDDDTTTVEFSHE